MTVFLLVSEEPDAILQTIQSRTQRFNIHGIKEPEISKVLQTKYGLQPEDADDIAHRSEGNFLKALETIHLSEENKLFFELFINLMRLSYQRKIRRNETRERCGSLHGAVNVRRIFWLTANV